MQLLDSVIQAAVPASTTRMQVGRPFKHGKKAKSVNIETTIPVTNSTGSGQTITQADALDFLNFVYASTTTQFGVDSGALDVVDNGLSAAQMRIMNVILSGQDFYLFNAVSGQWVQFSSITGSTAISASIAAAGNGTCKVLFTRPFTVVAVQDHQNDFCPGATQMQQLSFEITSGSSFNPTNAHFTQQSSVTLRIVADDIDAADGDDVWSSVPRAFRWTTSGVTLRGPSNGMLLALFDLSNPASSTPLTIYSIERGTDSPLQTPIEAQDYLAIYQREDEFTDPLNLGTLGTPLYRVPVPSKLSEVPTGTNWQMSQPGNDLATPNLLWIYIPAQTKGAVDKIGVNATHPSTGQTTVNLVNKFASDPQVPANIAACGPVSIKKPGQPDFQASPGAAAQRGASSTTTYVPPHVVAQAQATVAGTSASHATKIAQTLSRYVPGAISSNRTNPHPGAASIAATHGIKHK